MLPFPSGIELPAPTQFEQFWSFLTLYFILLGLTSLLLPPHWFVALVRIAFPFLPERLEDNDHD